MKNKKEKYIYLENMIEANLLDELLIKEGIPHFIRSYGDRAYDGLFQIQQGWAVVETPEVYKSSVIKILDELRK
ncbi:MAG: hypothetical protein RBT69_13400 [Spirochaetia bacterium]|jgi:hypothetical protein|nr:hypothetical protein [Spirochaetia bacterium]